MKKTLTFEGVGCVPVNDVENCRIRTAFINDEGKAIYLEIIAGRHFEKYINRRGNEKYRKIDNTICVDSCHYITGEHDDKTAKNGGDDCNNSRVLFEDKTIERTLDFHGEYTKAAILAFVNRYCHCSFTDIEVANEFDDYHVHGEKAYNLMEGSPIDYGLRAKRAAAFAAVDAEYKAVCHSKHSVISHSLPDAKTMKVTCYASDEALGSYPRTKILEVQR